jgi:hypothetical protein
MIRITLLIVLLAAGACYGGTRDPSVPDEKYVEYGSKYECVVPIYGECVCGKGKYHEFHASAVVISPRWVVTAAHVVHGQPGAKVKVRGKEFVLKRVIVNRHFDESRLGMYDIAMGETEGDMGLDFYPKLYEERNEAGKTAGICGYGITGTFSTGATLSDGKKRAGSNVVCRIENHVMVCSATDAKRTNMEFMISHGDSGGGLFIDQRLAGINSFVSAADKNPNSSYGDECHHTRISLFLPWIEGCMKGEEPKEEVEPQGEQGAE